MGCYHSDHQEPPNSTYGSANGILNWEIISRETYSSDTTFNVRVFLLDTVHVHRSPGYVRRDTTYIKRDTSFSKIIVYLKSIDWGIYNNPVTPNNDYIRSYPIEIKGNNWEWIFKDTVVPTSYEYLSWGTSGSYSYVSLSLIEFKGN